MNEEQPILYFEPDASQKLWNYTQNCDTEISGMGLVKELSPNIFLCYDIKIFKQKCTSVSTRIESEELAKEYTKLVRRGKGEEKCMNLWWHSHCDMNAFWSPRDRAEVSEWANSGYGISLVVNKRMEYLCRIDVFKPLQLLIPNIEIKLKSTNIYDKELEEKCKREIKNKVNHVWKQKTKKIDTLDNVTYLPPLTVKKHNSHLSAAEELEAGLDSFFRNLESQMSLFSTPTLLNPKILPPNFLKPQTLEKIKL